MTLKSFQFTTEGLSEEETAYIRSLGQNLGTITVEPVLLFELDRSVSASFLFMVLRKISISKISEVFIVKQITSNCHFQKEYQETDTLYCTTEKDALLLFTALLLHCEGILCGCGWALEPLGKPNSGKFSCRRCGRTCDFRDPELTIAKLIAIQQENRIPNPNW